MVQDAGIDSSYRFRNFLSKPELRILYQDIGPSSREAETKVNSNLPRDAMRHNNVRIMTMHAAKGSSGKLVIIMNANEGIIPREGGRGKTESEKALALQEDRRLFYVAMTRCKRFHIPVQISRSVMKGSL